MHEGAQDEASEVDVVEAGDFAKFAPGAEVVGSLRGKKIYRVKWSVRAADSRYLRDVCSVRFVMVVHVSVFRLHEIRVVLKLLLCNEKTSSRKWTYRRF